MFLFSFVLFLVCTCYCEILVAPKDFSLSGSDILSCSYSENGNCSWITKTKCDLVHPNLSIDSCKENCECLYHQCKCLKCSGETPDFCPNERRICVINKCLQNNTTISEDSLMKNNNKIAVFSTTLGDNYLFFTPITALIWKAFIHYLPFAIVVVPSTLPEIEKELLSYVLNKTQEAGGRTYVIDNNSPHKDAAIAQVSRLFAAMLDWPEDSYFLTSDVDMWILNYEHFHQQDKTKKFHLFYANAYAYKKEIQYPICYLGATSSMWKEVMQLNESEAFTNAVVNQISKGILEIGQDKWSSPGFGPQWYYDQILFGKKIGVWKGHSKETQKINRIPDRQFLKDRLDRGRWKFEGKNDLPLYLDAHLLRPGYTNENWSKLSILLDAILTKEQYNWTQNYRDEFLKRKRI